MDPSDLIRALSRPEAYPFHLTAPVEVVHTHISVLFFAADRVYKVKKPVNPGFLDYTTLAAREHFCREEVRLNRRLAPEVYLGVVPIARTREGSVRVGGDGTVIEYAVEMVRLPHDRMMSTLLEEGRIDNSHIDSIVHVLVEFHAACPTGEGVNEHAAPDELPRQVDENFQDSFAFASSSGAPPPGGVHALSTTLHDYLHEAAVAFLDQNEPLLKNRLAEERVRDGHGDVHTGNICLTEDRGVVIYDCIEFTPRFRCRDVACELAFLAMDLDFQCFRGFGSYLIHRYADTTGDTDMDRLVSFYKLHLAVVRGKVAALRAASLNAADPERRHAIDEARAYFHLAASYVMPPSLILLCGLPATGKSSAARAIARPFEAAVLNSDLVRKELAGLSPTERGSDHATHDIYSPEFTERTYAALRDRAIEHLSRGRTAIIDATLPSAALRRPFLEAARELDAPLLLVELTASDDVIRERLQARAHDSNAVSDADWEVYAEARSRFEPPDELPAHRRLSLEQPMDGLDITAAVLDRLIGLQ